MLEVTLQLPEEFRHWVADFLQALILAMQDATLPSIEINSDDVDLAAAWADGLSGDLKMDMDELSTFLKDPNFGEGPQLLTEHAAEGILRASAAFRLKLQDKFLKKFGEDNLIEDSINKAEMTILEKQAYLCYIFLGIIQGTLLQVMDPSLGEFFD